MRPRRDRPKVSASKERSPAPLTPLAQQPAFQSSWMTLDSSNVMLVCNPGWGAQT